MSLYSPYRFPTFPMATVRRKVFISYFHGDQGWAQTFVNEWAISNGIFTPKALGLNYDPNDRIDSDNTEYVMNQIRERFIDSSSVHIVLLGRCTHSRRYIDWEIKRSLRAGNGLLGIILPPDITAYLPDRFAANWSQDGTGYAKLYLYPKTAEELRLWIEDAYTARTARSYLVKNANDLWGYNHTCQVCKIVH